jgi:hypothetical protein
MEHKRAFDLWKRAEKNDEAKTTASNQMFLDTFIQQLRDEQLLQISKLANSAHFIAREIKAWMHLKI